MEGRVSAPRAPERDATSAPTGAPGTLDEALSPLRPGEDTELLAAGPVEVDPAPTPAPPPPLPALEPPSTEARPFLRHAPHFVLVLAVATMLPWLVVPLFANGPGVGPHTLRRLTYVVGPPHVISTFALYFDPGLRPLMRARRGRFVVVPIAVLALVPIMFAVAPDRVAAIGFLAASGWGAFHFSRQNTGVLTFVCAARGTAMPTRLERRLLTYVGVAGALGVMTYADFVDQAGLGALRPVLRGIAVLAMVAGVGLGIPALWRRRSDLVAALFLLESIVFFTPLFLMSSGGVLPYGVAHGAQYLVFMAVLVLYRPAGRPRPIGTLVAAGLLVAFGLGLVLLLMTASTSNAVLGVVAAVSAVHFLMDASLWRLREPIQRRYVSERFAFLAP